MRISYIIYIPALTITVLLPSCGNNSVQEKQEAAAPLLLSHMQAEASCVFLTSDEKNKPVISWVETDKNGNKHFYFSNWNASAKRFGQGIPIPIEPNTSIHEEGMPKLAVKGDGTIVAIYETSVPSPKSRFGLSDINCTLSFDKGKTWTARSSIQPDVPPTGSRSFCNIVRLDDGEAGAAWLDANPNEAGGGRPVKFAKTRKKGGFGPALLIEPLACQCCRTALSSDGSGNVSVVFRDLLSGSVRDISVSRSSNNGQTFSPSIPFSNDNWIIDGCPHNGPSVVSKGDRTYVTWFTGADHTGVYYAELNENNHLLTKRRLDANGRFSQLCLMPGGDRIVAYNKSYREGDSLYSRIMANKINDRGAFEKEITLPKVYASFPMVQPAGRDQLIVAWSGGGKIYYTVIKTKTIDIPVVYENPLAYRQFEPVRCCN